MDKSKLYCLEFIVSVIADIRGVQVDWASFAVGANKKQIRNWKKDNDAVKAKLAALQHDKQSVLGSECISKVTQRNLPSFHAQVLIDSGVAPGIPPLEDKPWTQKLAAKVSDLLKMVSVEWWASKHRFELLEKEKISLEHKANAALGMVEEFQSQIREEDDKFAASEVNLEDLSQSKARSGSDDVMLLTPGGEGLIDHAAEHAYSRRGLERCLLKHTTNHDFLSTQLAGKLLELNEVRRKHDFHESNHQCTFCHIKVCVRNLLTPHPIPSPIP
jgi:hypothetical protein